jgi:hypothetical protein
MKKPYELPSITLIGSVESLTQQNKCGGSGDYILSQQDPFTTSGCAPSQ